MKDEVGQVVVSTDDLEAGNYSVSLVSARARPTPSLLASSYPRTSKRKQTKALVMVAISQGFELQMSQLGAGAEVTYSVLKRAKPSLDGRSDS